MTPSPEEGRNTGCVTGKAIPAHLVEDLTALTIESSESALRWCDGCAAYHGTWPALRLGGAMRGLDTDRPVLWEMAERWLAGGGRRRVLIAGSADTGLLATMAIAAHRSPADVRFTVLDRCETPLRLVRRYAERAGLSVDTRVADLQEFTADEPQDIVFAHSVLRFIHRDRHVACLSRMRRWLKPGGCLLYGTRLRDVHCAADSRESKRRAMRVLRANEDLPLETRSRICAWLSESMDVSATLRQVWSREELLALFRQAGFANVCQRILNGGGKGRPRGVALPPRIVIAACCEAGSV